MLLKENKMEIEHADLLDWLKRFAEESLAENPEKPDDVEMACTIMQAAKDLPAARKLAETAYNYPHISKEAQQHFLAVMHQIDAVNHN
jgi:hypothetical protein